MNSALKILQQKYRWADSLMLAGRDAEIRSQNRWDCRFFAAKLLNGYKNPFTGFLKSPTCLVSKSHIHYIYVPHVAFFGFPPLYLSISLFLKEKEKEKQGENRAWQFHISYPLVNFCPTCCPALLRFYVGLLKISVFINQAVISKYVGPLMKLWDVFCLNFNDITQKTAKVPHKNLPPLPARGVI